MDTQHLLTAAETGARLCRGTVRGIDLDGSLVVALDAGADPLRCHMLEAGRDVAVVARDTVLVWHSGQPGDWGVVLGRIGRSHSTYDEDEDQEAQPPEELVIEAKHALILRVGEGSITIREDGRILIKGKDLVSHAQRLNRIKGGSVAIN